MSSNQSISAWPPGGRSHVVASHSLAGQRSFFVGRTWVDGTRMVSVHLGSLSLLVTPEQAKALGNGLLSALGDEEVAS